VLAEDEVNGQDANAQDANAQDGTDSSAVVWRHEGNELIRRMVRRSLWSNGEHADSRVIGAADARIVGWLPKEESDFVDEQGRAAALWHIVYDDHKIGEEDLEEYEVVESLALLAASQGHAPRLLRAPCAPAFARAPAPTPAIAPAAAAAVAPVPVPMFTRQKVQPVALQEKGKVSVKEESSVPSLFCRALADRTPCNSSDASLRHGSHSQGSHSIGACHGDVSLSPTAALPAAITAPKTSPISASKEGSGSTNAVSCALASPHNGMCMCMCACLHVCMRVFTHKRTHTTCTYA